MDHRCPETGPPEASEARRDPPVVVHVPISIRQDTTGEDAHSVLQHSAQQQCNDRAACIRELTRAAEESTLLRQSLEHMTKACDSYQQQLQEILDQRNLLYRDYASAVIEMKGRYTALEQTNTQLRQTNDDYRDKLFSLETAGKRDASQDMYANTAAEVVLLRHKLQRVCKFDSGDHVRFFFSGSGNAQGTKICRMSDSERIVCPDPYRFLHLLQCLGIPVLRL